MFSDCLAEDIINVCEQFFCGGTFPPVGDNPPISTDFFFPPRPVEEGMKIECIALDCSNLDCGTAGFFSDLDIWNNGMPTGLISIEPEVQLVCF